MKVKRKVIAIDEERCDGCGNCVPSCAEGAIKMINGKARVINERFCDGLGACLGDCPRGALKLVEREAEEFDAEAVEAYLQNGREEGRRMESAADSIAACACPSKGMKTFAAGSRTSATGPAGNCQSHPAQWPVQIRLISAAAPFLKKADLLVAADCVPVACPSFHADFLPGKVVMIGCPKFDDTEHYRKKFTEIFQTANIRSVTVLIMEVPCCSGLPGLLKKAMTAADVDIPLQEIVITARGGKIWKQKKAS